MAEEVHKSDAAKRPTAAQGSGGKGKSEVAQREEKILEFWNKNNIFKKTESKGSREFVFYDGPPFANGLPHYGHILAGTIKDAIPRYKTMRGYKIVRTWGWDCHGLPVENLIEKELGLKSKKDILDYGIARFNEAARVNIMKDAASWEVIVPRMGRFVDMKTAYRTMDTSYTESVWWSFKTLHNKGLVYKGFKSMHLCPHCETTLSNFEVAQGYKDITDLAVTVMLPLAEDPAINLLIWTTTPWTLPGNMAAAVREDIEYTKFKVTDDERFAGKVFIAATDRVATLGHAYDVVGFMKGAELVGKSYHPPFGYYKDAALSGIENAWKIYHAPYVSTEEGTGIVHLAPAYGDEDMELAKEKGISLVHHVNTAGRFTGEVVDFAGLPVKPKEDPQKTDVEIVKNLTARGLLFKKEKITHSYPHCWRCDTPLLNYAASSWFVRVTAIKDKIVAQNKKISWVPPDVRDGRFGKWLEGARDWAISRSRFWGAPLPVWESKKTGERVVVGNIEELKKRVVHGGNAYFLMRHGEAESNVKNILNATKKSPYHLTKNGRESAEKEALRLRGRGITHIFHSPLLRTKETAEIVARTLNIPSENIIEDERLREINPGIYEGGSREEYHAAFKSVQHLLRQAPEGGESWIDVKKRVGDLLYDVDDLYQGKGILFVTHDSPAFMLFSAASGEAFEACCVRKGEKHTDFLKTGEVRELPFTPLPHNKEFELDLHRPHIDNVKLRGDDGEVLERVPDVFDCWYESGSMPFAQHHYLGEPLPAFNPQGGLFSSRRGYPADFIAEGMDQTRGWFYSLLVLGTALFGAAPYRRVIVNGLVLAEDGQKMSKRLHNYTDPLALAERYGADSIRYYMLSSPLMRGEDLNFSDKGVEDIMRKNIVRTDNVLSFYKLYKSDSVKESAPSPHVLDHWLLSRTHELVRDVTAGLENYELDRATRPIADFIDDLSTWYLRRSRERFKGEDEKDRACALRATREALLTLAKTMAPFMPFFAEYLFQELRREEDEESVHLAAWPGEQKADDTVLKEMATVRRAASLGLLARAEAGIKVRQPLSELTLKGEIASSHLFLIAEEVNVKNVRIDTDLAEEAALDTNITPKLREEGVLRDHIRLAQDARKEMELIPEEQVDEIVFKTTPEAAAALENNKMLILKVTNARHTTTVISEETPAVEIKK